MGAFMVFDIGFKDKKDRKKFETRYRPQILVNEHSNSDGFGAWTLNRNIFLDVVYFMGFMGYAEPKVILKECKKANINIKFLAWIPINDRQAHWEKIRGRW